MRHNLLDLIKCPACGKSDFKIETSADDPTDIREGALICADCGLSYEIKGGITYLFNKLSHEAEAEIQALRDETSENNPDFQDRQWLLNFPYNNQLGIDARAERITKLNSENEDQL